MLSACSFRMDRGENPVKLPVAWDSQATATAQASVPADWWKSFNSPVLDSLVAEALTGNPNLKIAEERLRQAERALSVARDNLLPDLSVNAGSSRTRSGGSGQSDVIRSSTTVNAQLRYDVDLWGGRHL